MLTRKQNELLLFINKRLNEGGVSPSFDEMKEALRLKSKSGIHRLITGLEERGFLRRLPHRARALQVLKLPEAAAMPAPNVTPLLNSRRGMAEAREGFVPQVVRGERMPLAGAIQAANEAQALSLPLYGRIAAGTPIEALRDNSTTVDVPVSLLGSGAHYCLEVQGNSMVEAGIQNGDIAIIRRANSAEVGRDRGRPDRRQRGDAQAPAQERRLDRARAGQRRVRDAHLRTRPGQDPGPPRGTLSPLSLALPSRLFAGSTGLQTRLES